MRILTSLALISAAVGHVFVGAQQIGQNKPGEAAESYTLSVKVQLVTEAVVVKDKDGKPIPGLTAKDFAVTEDGVPQTVRICEHQDLSALSAPLPVSTPATENVRTYNKLAHTQIAPESVDNERYKNRRLLALYFDMSAMNPADQLRALSAAEKFLRTQMTTVDLVSILRYQGGAVDILQDFTSDRDKLLSILQTLVVGEAQGDTETTDDASSADTGAAFGQDDSEFNIFNTDRQLSALETAVKMLGQLNEKKSLIYFASGLRLNGVDNQAQLHATVDSAIKAGVSFWPIDTRGLVAQAPLGDATQGSQGNSGIYTGAAAQANTSNFQQSQDTLYALAGDTGGKALFDNNDLTRGIVQAQEAISDTTSSATTRRTPRRTATSAASRFPSRRILMPSLVIAKDTTPTRNSVNSPSLTRSASLKMHSCSKILSLTYPSPWRSITSSSIAPSTLSLSSSRFPVAS
jgi:VWFA-related protein